MKTSGRNLPTSSNEEVGAPLSPAADDIRNWLVSELATRLRMDPKDIDPRERFKHYGLDSADAVQLVGDLSKRIDRRLPVTLLWQYPTISELISHLVSPTVSITPKRPPANDGITHEPIAIIGMGCRFPGAENPDAFWRLLQEGVDAVQEVPPDRWDAESYFDRDPRAPGKMATRWGGFLDDITGFDAKFFGISPRESQDMDPQQRLMLEVSWEALEDAGQPPLALKNSQTGVFYGAIWNDYASNRQRGGVRCISPHTATGTHHSIIANRLSYFLGLRGPSMTVDTACSSSLVAVHLACQSLRAGESDMVLAGGVNLISAPDSTIAMSKFGAMAPDGKSKAFDARANGYVRGEGAGVVVLKRLSDAVSCGDQIYAVIRGSAVNNDGFSNGLTAPSQEAQEAMLRESYERAGISPDRVHYVEAHGTGTALGDPIEAAALGSTLGAGRPADAPLRIGSVKTNIGHLEAAAGIAGMLKVLLAMKNGELPPTLHFNEPNPNIDLDGLRLCVQAEGGPWTPDGGSRIAGVSSFGFGGTNCHVVLEELPLEEAHVVPLGAESAETLYTLARKTERILDQQEESLEIVARSAATTASQGPYRLAVSAVSPKEAKHALSQHLAIKPRPPVGGDAESAAPQVVFVCPGQGSQWWRMGLTTFQQEPVFRAKIQECDEAMRPFTGWSVIRELTSTQERSRLHEVDVVQPMIFAVQVALGALWRSWGVEPSIIVGHSMGEISAAHIAGSLDIQDAARVICSRSHLIREKSSGQGQMAVVELSAQELQQIIDGLAVPVYVAAINGPGTTVVGGERAAISLLIARLADEGIVCHPVDVDYASHTPHMDVLTAPLITELDGLRTHQGSIPVMSTVTQSLADENTFNAAYWAANLRQPVQFWPCIDKLIRTGHHTFIELSGHPVLARSMNHALVSAGGSNVIPSFRRGQEQQVLREGLRELHMRGVPIRWHEVYAGVEKPLFKEASKQDANGGEAPARALFTLSARDGDALRAHARATLLQLEQTTDSLTDICYTSNVRRSHHDARIAVQCKSVEQIRERLRSFIQLQDVTETTASSVHRPKVAFVFPGHGGQWWKMGQELLRDEPVFQRTIIACEKALGEYTDWSLREELTRTQSASRIDEIDIAQPATFAIQVALASLWNSWGITPDAVVGHSMGEVAAAHVAGAISLEDAARIICLRSRLMKRVSGQGAMAVVELPRHVAELVIADESSRLSVAGANSPHSCVLSGDPDALEDVLQTLESEGVFSKKVRVDVASHSPQMESLRVELVELLASLQPRATKVPLYSSVLAKLCRGDSLDSAYWGRNLRDPFLFNEVIGEMIQDGYHLFTEIGPHPVLSSAIGAMQQSTGEELTVLPSMKRDEDERSVMLSTLATFYERGLSPDWRGLYHKAGRLVSLPTYPWQRERHWPEEPTRGSHEEKSLSVPAEPARRLKIASTLTSRANMHLSDVWELDISEETHPYLTQHVVQGELIVPASFHIKLALDIARQALNDNASLREVVFEKALFLPSETSVTVQMLLMSGTDGNHRFEIASRQSDIDHSSWTRHVTGSIASNRQTEEASSATIDIAAVRDGLRPWEQTEHYQLLGKHGIAYGPVFRGISKIWRGEREALTLVSKPAALDGSAGAENEMHPALLDAVLQTVYASAPPEVLDPTAGDSFVPAAIGRFQITAPLTGQMWCHAQLLPARGAGALEADLVIYDTNGKKLVEIGDMRFERVSRQSTEVGDDPSRWHYEMQWERRNSNIEQQPSKGTWLVLAGHGPSGTELVEYLEAGGGTCRRIAIGDIETLRRELDSVILRGVDFRGVVHLWGLDLSAVASPTAAAVEQTASDLVRVVQELMCREWASAPKLWVITQSAQHVPHDSSETVSPSQATLWGLGRSIETEHPEIWGGLVDIGGSSADIQALHGELTKGETETQIAFRAGERFTLRLVHAEKPPSHSPFLCRPDGTYLITGGLGGVGMEVAHWLVERGARRLILLGRTGLPHRETWDTVHDASLRAKIDAIRELEDAGASIAVMKADVGDPDQMRAVFHDLRTNYPPLRGIMHAAGTIAPELITDLTPQTMATVFRSKVAGTLVLDELIHGISLDHLVLFSSVESVIGMRGQAPYAAANSFLESYAHQRTQAGHPTVAVHWGVWGGTGLVAREDEARFLSTHGLQQMQPEDALEQLGAVISSRVSSRVVSAMDWPVFRAAFVNTPSRSNYLEHVGSARSMSAPSTKQLSLANQLAQVSAADRAHMVTRHIREIVAASLQCAPEKLDARSALTSLGLDSLLAAEVRNRIQLDLGVQVPMLALIRGSTAGLSAKVIEALSAEQQTN
ncbi:type I polyketide synthase [Streptomyces sp900105245]|uniref:Type I polyketide synthase n=1 Tax=Streptomyces sp. 900105245 TaxID=3154379 RepID=A0ABV1ULP2_9ACTN